MGKEPRSVGRCDSRPLMQLSPNLAPFLPSSVLLRLVGQAEHAMHVFSSPWAHAAHCAPSVALRRGVRLPQAEMLCPPPGEYTQALYWTESYYDQAAKRWVGRVQTAGADELAQP